MITNDSFITDSLNVTKNKICLIILFILRKNFGFYLGPVAYINYNKPLFIKLKPCNQIIKWGAALEIKASKISNIPIKY